VLTPTLTQFSRPPAEVVFTETNGETKLEWTVEEYRDNFDAITDRSELTAMDGPDDWHEFQFSGLIAAGAEPPAADENGPSITTPGRK
jgi:hypothetical protein